ncbi:uncharacterized protein [Haliotis asinina]|uniref:uncharacterized protein n=1 Tax=Haliotis asinina TaxID=109174 RepID=UPI0035323BD3
MDRKGKLSQSRDTTREGGGGRDGGRQFLSPETTNLDRAPSLHGLHAQSSTETSGLGETITSGFSSQESIHSLRGSTRTRGDTGGLSLTPEEAEAHRRELQARGTGREDMRTDSKKNRDRSRMNDHYSSGPGHANYNEYFSPGTAVMDTLSPMGLQREHIDEEWDKRSGSRRSSAISRSSQGGSTKSRSSVKAKFLGASLGSQWAKWSRDRRASFRRRVEMIENSERKKERTSTPVKKARQEGLKFVHPDLERKYLSEDDIKELRRHKQEQYNAYRVIEKGKKKNRFKSEVQLSMHQWHVLSEFWEHEAFVRLRWLGVFVSMVTVLVMIVSITNSYWHTYELKPPHSVLNLSIHEGLWVNCSRASNATSPDVICNSTKGRDWQNAVVGLMIFAATFGFVASMLSICGVCTTPLPRKIYYFHSAGEIFLVCALSTGVALIIFPVAVELDHTILSHRYGIGYGLGWGGAFFFFAAAICMTLDELVRESARVKCCKWCWKGSGSERTELRQV